MNHRRWKILKTILFLLIFGLVVGVIIVFKKEAPKILGMYYLLYLRPELFIVAAYASGQNPIAIFIQVFLFTTFTTWLTWFLTGVAQKKISQKKEERKLEFLKKYRFTKKIWELVEKIKLWLNKSQKEYQRKIDETLKWILRKSRYLLFVLFVIPVPLLDTSCVIMAKITNLPYGLYGFIIINAIKIILILLGCTHFL